MMFFVTDARTDDVVTARKLTPREMHDVMVPGTDAGHLALILFVLKYGDGTARSRYHFVHLAKG
jgi:hypothetical protein